MTVENTRTRDNMVHLAGMLSEGQSGYITGMEAAGQRQILNSQVLPAEAHSDWADLEALGIVRGEPVSGDPLFVNATIPEGWTREGSNHAMHSYLVDERGVRRVNIFYKAAFYDRRADIGVMNVGYNLATDAIYGDGPASLPEKWGVLTSDERADFMDSIESYIADAERSPSIYGDRLPKVWELFHAAKGEAA